MVVEKSERQVRRVNQKEGAKKGGIKEMATA